MILSKKCCQKWGTGEKYNGGMVIQEIAYRKGVQTFYMLCKVFQIAIRGRGDFPHKVREILLGVEFFIRWWESAGE